jgi:mannose-6-phosphate isomerase
MKIEKPWGYEELLESNKDYVLKKLFMKKGHRCSLQKHIDKKETIYVLSGSLEITREDSKFYLDSGSVFTIYPEDIHRMRGITNVFYLEVSTPFLDDIIRLEDDYGRT